ncbi:murein L,D-transpeptidase catalytic domain family protein [Mangrovibacterium diazotrophicum]|uniref:L,D-transpeptidase-like protein n=1 Tax=Mangrovibacterium diazotrophicum TaxID=1261403 RepID=A0A419VV15_9BACT|nr:murein L,D-transpeptidase catalytic domain family protein [Mangrovibacterium diazotrophicum]RKD85973.1 L,D-transpeptidase-like protein [Mangrovibacterium diazotrophicum]
MKRVSLFFALSLVIIVIPSILHRGKKNSEGTAFAIESVDSLYVQYTALNLNGKLPYEVFVRAMEGFRNFHFNNNHILTIVDFTKSSVSKRFFVIDLKANKLLFECLVAHGKNSGIDFAQHFSNTEQSLMSSPGFYTTAETYQGKHGYSLRLDGLEKGINDRARARAIVIHAADYVSEQFIQRMGRLGRSWGCPALPPSLNKEIIDSIKNGSCLYIHTNDKSYLADSPVN